MSVVVVAIVDHDDHFDQSLGPYELMPSEGQRLQLIML